MFFSPFFLLFECESKKLKNSLWWDKVEESRKAYGIYKGKYIYETEKVRIIAYNVLEIG